MYLERRQSSRAARKKSNKYPSGRASRSLGSREVGDCVLAAPTRQRYERRRSGPTSDPESGVEGATHGPATACSRSTGVAKQLLSTQLSGASIIPEGFCGVTPKDSDHQFRFIPALKLTLDSNPSPNPDPNPNLAKPRMSLFQCACLNCTLDISYTIVCSCTAKSSTPYPQS